LQCELVILDARVPHRNVLRENDPGKGPLPSGV
jgi:hypothetical protein